MESPLAGSRSWTVSVARSLSVQWGKVGFRRVWAYTAGMARSDRPGAPVSEVCLQRKPERQYARHLWRDFLWKPARRPIWWGGTVAHRLAHFQGSTRDSKRGAYDPG